MGLVSILTVAKAAMDSAAGGLDIVQLNASDTELLLFTDQCAEVTLHYCAEEDIASYVHCNGTDCVLCRVGRKRETRLLLPVYTPSKQAVGVLPVSTSQRPKALLPLLAPLIEKGEPVYAFMRFENWRYEVASAPLRPGVDDGARQIAEFVERQKDGQIDLTCAYQRISNESLRKIPAIAESLARRGASA